MRNFWKLLIVLLAASKAEAITPPLTTITTAPASVSQAGIWGATVTFPTAQVIVSTGMAVTPAASSIWDITGSSNVPFGRFDAQASSRTLSDGALGPLRIDSDGSLFSRPSIVSTATVTRVADAVTTAQLLAENGSRRGAIFYNDSAQSLYLKFGVSATTLQFTLEMAPESYFEIPTPIYTGRIDGIWQANTANASCVNRRWNLKVRFRRHL